MSQQSTSLKGMEKAVPPNGQGHYSSAASIYSNKPLPALPPTQASSTSSSYEDVRLAKKQLDTKAEHQQKDRKSAKPAAAAADLTFSALPEPLNLPRRPKTASGHRDSAVPPPLNLPPAVPSPPKTLPQVPPRHPGRLSPRRTSAATTNNRPATGHRPAHKIQQLTGYDVDVHDGLRGRASSHLNLNLHFLDRPTDTSADRSSATNQDHTHASGLGAAPRPLHSYRSFSTPSEYGSDSTASGTGSRQVSAQFSTSSRPSWSSYSPHQSLDGKASSRSRDSFSDAAADAAAFDYHKFASELAGPTDRLSADSHTFSHAGSSSNSYSHTRESSSSQPYSRSSGQSSIFREASLQRSPLQQIEALAMSQPLSVPGKQQRGALPKGSRHVDKKGHVGSPEEEPRLVSAFDSDSDDDNGITDSIRGFFTRRVSLQNEASGSKSQRTSREESDKSLLSSARERAKEWRSDRRKDSKSPEDITKFF